MGGYQIVWADPLQKNPLNTLIHEATHVFQHTMEYVVEDKIGKELEAYSIANISETLIMEFQRQLKELQNDLPGKVLSGQAGSVQNEELPSVWQHVRR